VSNGLVSAFVRTVAVILICYRLHRVAALRAAADRVTPGLFCAEHPPHHTAPAGLAQGLSDSL